MAFPVSVSSSPPAPSAARGSIWLGYGLGLLGVGLAALAALAAEELVAASNLALVFVVPVLVIAIYFELGAAVFTAVISVAAFDLLFVAPRYSLAVGSPSDLWALALFGFVAMTVGGLAAAARRRAVAAEHEARGAEALRRLAHRVLEDAPDVVVTVEAAEVLATIFGVPAVVAMARGGDLGARAISGDAKLTRADEEAARWALQNGLPTRAQSFPFRRGPIQLLARPDAEGGSRRPGRPGRGQRTGANPSRPLHRACRGVSPDPLGARVTSAAPTRRRQVWGTSTRPSRALVEGFSTE